MVCNEFVPGVVISPRGYATHSNSSKMLHTLRIRPQLERGTTIALVAAVALAGCGGAPELGTQRPTSAERAEHSADNANIRTEQLTAV